MAMLRMRWAALALAGCSMVFVNCSGQNDGERATQSPTDELSSIPQMPHRAVCDAAPHDGWARCHALVVTNAAGQAAAFATPSGLGPSDLRSAYNLPTSGGSGKIVAIVDA